MSCSLGNTRNTEPWERRSRRKKDQAQSAHSRETLKTFHPPWKVMQHWPDASEPREDESGRAMIQYLTCTDEPDYRGSHVSSDYKHGLMKTL